MMAKNIRALTRIRREHARYRAALEHIAQCNRGQGYMPELARRVLAQHEPKPG